MVESGESRSAIPMAFLVRARKIETRRWIPAVGDGGGIRDGRTHTHTHAHTYTYGIHLACFASLVALGRRGRLFKEQNERRAEADLLPRRLRDGGVEDRAVAVERKLRKHHAEASQP